MQYLWGEDWSKNWMESGRRGGRRKNWPASELTHQLSDLTVWLHNWIMHKTNVMVHLFLVTAATTAAATTTTTTTGDLSDHLLHLSLDNCWTIWWWPRNCCTTCICCPFHGLFWSTLFGFLFGLFGDLASGKIRSTNYILQHFSLTLQFFSLNLFCFSNLILATNQSFSLFLIFFGLYQILLLTIWSSQNIITRNPVIYVYRYGPITTGFLGSKLIVNSLLCFRVIQLEQAGDSFGHDGHSFGPIMADLSHMIIFSWFNHQFGYSTSINLCWIILTSFLGTRSYSI